ncbi:MAG: NAD-dependent epimerase/dehydratase family protein [Planctomycetales bacterium]|nr:NAD-dependent epimerase/dehydratase family protein [Planctomycetales bacterium]NIM07869.1 NAD-dependent epimerase/dehydratase family protein [Planctomycetales bacterium]NIN07355.1 NAD-dependent epimerase/dehydratase family protein [Planctomycetales bacterium]NIN76459.1 NAD-dependent epimerase/dehydratase family protein [Planctomycetales bacterium]NIO33650.1 NAD-dependent epimerase/dehydratase family protein [Planctomycetales bacterium]
MSSVSCCTLVTGATGLVGNNVVRRLLAEGRSVRVLVRRGSDARPLAGLKVDVCYGDTRDRQAVSQAATGVAQIIHSAAMVKIGRTNIDQFRAVNVEGTRNVALAARRENIRMLHVSSTDAIGTKSLEVAADEETPFDKSITTPYLLTKYEAEEEIAAQVAAGLDGVIVNPSFMLGPWDWKPSSGQMLLEVGRGRGWLAPAGYFSVADVRDVADGILAALEKGQRGRRYILAGRTMSYLDGWRLFAQVTGARRPLRRLGRVGARLVGWVGDLGTLITGNEPSFNSGAIAIANLPRNYSSARAEAELGYRNRPLVETVEDTWRWFQDHGFV